MINGSNDKINWAELSKLVDPQYNAPKGNIGTNVHDAEIEVRQAKENSMDELNTEQQTIVDRLLARYEDFEQNEILVAECEQQIKQYIIEQYNNDGCTLVLMSSLPKDNKPEKGKLYVEKMGNQLRYIVETPNGKVVECTLDIRINGHLTPALLQNIKYQILEETTKRVHTPVGPAIYRGNKLPLDFQPYRHQSDAEKQCYYNNPWHSAYRYFGFHVDNKPNPWLHPEALHLANHYDDEARQRFNGPNIPQREMAIIHGMWLALNDVEFAISDMHTHETAKAELIKTFGSLGRAHNWDKHRPVYELVEDEFGNPVRKQKTRYNNDGTLVNVTEEYDDLEADKPSCPWGVETRLTQFVMLALKQDANERILREVIVRDKFKEELVGEVTGKNTVFNVIDKMDLATLTKLKEALDDLVAILCGEFDDLEEEQKTLLKSIQPFTTKDLADFIDSCKKYFGDYRFTQKLNAKVEYLGERYDNYGQLALGFAKNPWGVFYDAIAERIEQRKEDLGCAKPNVKPSPDAEKLPAEDVDALRQQLVDFAVRTNNLQLIYQLQGQAVSPDFIKQTANQFKDQLQPVAAPEPVKVNAEVLPIEDPRERAIAYAIENNLLHLVDEFLDAPLEDLVELMQALELSKNQDAAEPVKCSPESTRQLAEQAEAETQTENQDYERELALAIAMSKELPIQAEAARPAPILNTFKGLQNQQTANNVIKLAPAISLRLSDPAKQPLLLRLNENQEAIALLNSNDKLSEVFMDNIESNPAIFDGLMRFTPHKVVQFLTGLQTKIQLTAVPLRIN